MPASARTNDRPSPRSSTRGIRLARTVALFGCAVLSTACFRTRRDPLTGRVAVDVRSPLQRGTVWDARLTAQTPPFSSATGTARADVLDGQTTLAIRVTNLTPGATHPWRIHDGKCGALGAQFGESSVYPPLLVNNQGVAEGTAKLPALDIARNYKVRVFVSPADSTSEVTCGNLTYR